MANPLDLLLERTGRARSPDADPEPSKYVQAAQASLEAAQATGDADRIELAHLTLDRAKRYTDFHGGYRGKPLRPARTASQAMTAWLISKRTGR
jgi:hypothetical protein